MPDFTYVRRRGLVAPQPRLNPPSVLSTRPGSPRASRGVSVDSSAKLLLAAQGNGHRAGKLRERGTRRPRFKRVGPFREIRPNPARRATSSAATTRGTRIGLHTHARYGSTTRRGLRFETPFGIFRLERRQRDRQPSQTRTRSRHGGEEDAAPFRRRRGEGSQRVFERAHGRTTQM